MQLSIDRAMGLPKGTSIIYTKFDSMDSQEMKWVGLDYCPTGLIRGIVEDEDGNHWWGFLYQFHTFD
jgi:hypothetical protein